MECNKAIVDYLDITLDLKNGTYKPYQKPDSTLQYIHTKSIEERLSKHSSTEIIFNEAAKFTKMH